MLHRPPHDSVRAHALPTGLVWQHRYKTTDGKAVNALSSDEPKTAAEASQVIAECHESWKALKARGPGDTGFWLKA